MQSLRRHGQLDGTATQSCLMGSPDGRCLEMLERTKEILNYETMELQPLTLERWKAAFKPKKASSTVGLDTVSKRDLMAFPDSLHQQLLDT